MHNFKAGQRVRVMGTGFSGAVKKMNQMVGNVYTVREVSDMYIILESYAWDYRDLEDAENEIVEPESKKPLFFNTENLIQ